MKVQFDKSVHPYTFQEIDLVLSYDKDNKKLGPGKFKSLWYDLVIVKHDL
jgi:hypothetical protein